MSHPKTATAFHRIRCAAGVGAALLLAATAATAQVPSAPGASGIDASGSTRMEREACMRGATQQDRETCLKEANNAAADKRRGLINDAGEPLGANRFERCQVLPNAEDRAACEARISGRGNVSGSVAGGGVLREVETVVLPANAGQVRVQPVTDDPVILAPRR